MTSLTSVIIKNSKRRELTNTSRFLTALAFLIVTGFLSFMMIGISVIATKRLGSIGQSYAFVNMLLFMNFIILFSESIFYSLNTLYFSKDLNTFLRLPIKPRDLVGAKLKNMILSQYEMEILMLAIPIVTYGILSKVSALFYIYLFIILWILPIIPIAITTLIVAMIMRFTNFIKNKNKVMYITVILAIILLGMLLGCFNQDTEEFSTATFERIILQADGLANEISNRFILIKPIMNTLLEYDNLLGLRNLIVYIVESFIIYEIVVWMTSKIYLKGVIGTIINGEKYTKKLEVLTQKDLKQKHKVKAYFEKEWKITFRSPIFLIQCILMPLIYPVITAVIVALVLNFAQEIKDDTINLLMRFAQFGIGYAIFLAIGQGFFMLNFSSIIAVSKDGKSAILSKTFPISLEKQFHLKTRIGIFVNLLPIIIVCMAYHYLAGNLWITMTMFCNLLLLNTFGEKWKLLVDLNNPQIKWDTEYTMMKQNTNVMYELFYTLLVIILIGMIGVMYRTAQNVGIAILCILILLNVMINHYVRVKQEKIFYKLF